MFERVRERDLKWKKKREKERLRKMGRKLGYRTLPKVQHNNSLEILGKTNTKITHLNPV